MPDTEQAIANTLREHLIEVHDYPPEYFDTDYPVGGPIHDLSTLRWLHACQVKSTANPDGCARI